MLIGDASVHVAMNEKSQATAYPTKLERKNITQCTSCAKKLKIKNLFDKHKRQEVTRRIQAKKTRTHRIGKVPEKWLKLPLTDSTEENLEKSTFSEGFPVSRIIYRLIESMVDAWNMQKKSYNTFFQRHIISNLHEISNKDNGCKN